ncbi:endonuclease/exonuclease/phosphatase family protein [Bdellovibrio sp. HCB337]|uniref:endonuclease/exonuclease/phosphatase family protein n=1 Tax=Bdellovibrio sp. HCB337 TaxID=3394358 RepID=UPI0039A4B2AB
MTSWNESLNLKFCFINAENLFLLFDEIPTAEALKLDETKWQRLSTSTYENKPLKKCLELARALKTINADVIMLCEVGGFESLKNYNELFLDGAYSPILTEGNSNRNIDVGFLIRKGLPFYFDLQSNKNRPINYLYPHERESIKHNYPVSSVKAPATSHKFSRDVAELRLFKKDVDKPFLGILLTHLKSRLDPESIDPGGFERRQAELLTLIDIYREFVEKHPDAPTMVVGDFNGNASITNTDEEFKPLYDKTELKDVLELTGVSSENRATFYQVRSTSRTEGRQIDFCFLAPKLASHLKEKSALVYRYKDEFGMDVGVPMTLDAKLKLPSDHYPIVFEIENLKIW